MISSLKAALCSTVCLSVLLPNAGFAGTWIINRNDDAFVSIGGTGSITTGTGSALSGTGDIRWVLNQIINDQAVYTTSTVTQTIQFDPSVSGVTLSNFPPPINLFRADTITITGSQTIAGPQTIINGSGFRPFYLMQGTVSLVSLQITNGLAQGGAGSCGGGGGMGAGGAIFIDSADVTLTDVILSHCGAISGSGGSTATGSGGGLGGGGGGLGGAGGGNPGSLNSGAGGGGGYCGRGGDAAGATSAGGGGSIGAGGAAGNPGRSGGGGGNYWC
ncbi:MAG: hypothetical protein NTX49_10105 [Chlamydiae bacterium]|nr:hypothetical protein [Chlamydiota bacterium]